MKRPISLDLRQRILASYDQNEGSRQEIAQRFRVSLGMVKKLIQPPPAYPRYYLPVSSLWTQTQDPRRSSTETTRIAQPPPQIYKNQIQDVWST